MAPKITSFARSKKGHSNKEEKDATAEAAIEEEGEGKGEEEGKE